MSGDSCGHECANDQRIAQLEKADLVRGVTLEKMDVKLDTMLVKLNRIEVLETSQTHHADAVGRAHKRIDEVGEILKDCTKFKHTAEGMAKMLWVLLSALTGSVFMLAVKILFFMGAHGVT